ncbi:MAG: plasmid pRiA4b ORF-3 family protein [Terracidiphilus sp.]
MTTKSISSAQDVYQIKVTLLWTKPPIWRRLLVPSLMTFEQLHYVLQTAMGWDNSHMHEFSVAKRRIGEPEPSDGFAGFTDMSPADDESTARICDVLKRAGAKMTYTYDFGDSWEHSIVLEKRLPPDQNTVYPTCLDGQLACPPEDCGGIPGFYRLVDILAHPKHKEHGEMREWVGDNYNPEAFSVDKVNKLLAPKHRPRKK